MCVILEEDGYSLTEIAQPELANIMAANENLAFLRIVESYDQLQDRAFSGAVGAHDDLDVV